MQRNGTSPGASFPYRSCTPKHKRPHGAERFLRHPLASYGAACNARAQTSARSSRLCLRQPGARCSGPGTLVAHFSVCCVRLGTRIVSATRTLLWRSRRSSAAASNKAAELEPLFGSAVMPSGKAREVRSTRRPRRQAAEMARRARQPAQRSVPPTVTLNGRTVL